MDAEHDIEVLVYGFETCTVPRARWNHQTHLTVALYYLRRYPLDVAIARMRDGLKRFLFDFHGTEDEYHETMTVAWMQILASFARSEDKGQALSELLSELIKRYGDKQLIFSYYSYEVLMSPRARTSWIPPDKREFELPPLQRGTSNPSLGQATR